jgi:hypothetical protein
MILQKILKAVENIIHSVFFGLKSTGHSVDQLYILDKSKLTITSISFILLGIRELSYGIVCLNRGI